MWHRIYSLLNRNKDLKDYLKKILPKKLIFYLKNILRKQKTIIEKRKKYKYINKYNYKPKEEMKIIFIGGDTLLEYNGGTKIYNLWTQLLRENNYDAYITIKGDRYKRWLVNHQPVINYSKIDDFRKEGYETRFVTSWLDNQYITKILKEKEQIFYIDADLKWTLEFKHKLEKFLKKNIISKIATHSRYIQSWYMANYGIKPVLINEWSDINIFYPDSTKRIKGRLGCMIETEEDESIYEFLQGKCKKEPLCRDIIKISGDEREVANMMKTVDIFVGLNQGKHSLWGEGCPRTQQEAMHCGCVVVAFDVLGNREYLYNNWTGILVPCGSKDTLWEVIKYLLRNEDLKEKIRENSLNLIKNLFTTKDKFRLISEFLNLDGLTKAEFSEIFDYPFYLHESEIPFLSKYAYYANDAMVEIGCAFGGSTTIFLLNKKDNVKVYSIDPFVKDSKGDFIVNKSICKKVIKKALSKKGCKERINDWKLFADYSQNVVKKWNQKIDLLFIDGSHFYEEVKRDFETWSKFVKKGGLILLHDSRKDNIDEDKEGEIFSQGYIGPTLLAKEIEKSDKFDLIDTCYSISVFRKK